MASSCLKLKGSVLSARRVKQDSRATTFRNDRGIDCESPHQPHTSLWPHECRSGPRLRTLCDRLKTRGAASSFITTSFADRAKQAYGGATVQ